MWYNDNSDIDIYEIHAFGARPVHTEVLGRKLGRFCPLGLDYACTDMMRYKMAFSYLSV